MISLTRRAEDGQLSFGESSLPNTQLCTISISQEYQSIGILYTHNVLAYYQACITPVFQVGSQRTDLVA